MNPPNRVSRQKESALSALEHAEEKALEEDRAKLAWLSDSPRQITQRVPNSVFALATAMDNAGGQ